MAQSGSYYALLKVPGFLALIMAAILGRLASRLFFITLILFVLFKYESPPLVGWITFAAVAPGLIISPLAGVFLDRFGPTLAIRLDMLISAILAMAVALAGWTGWVSPLLLFVLAILFSLAGPLGAAGTRTLLPRVVPAELLDRANGLDTSTYAMIDVAGPALAAMLISFIGAETTMALTGLAYALAAAILLMLPPLPGLAASGTSLLRQTLEGIAIVVRHRTLRGLAISYSLYQIAWGILYVTIPVVVLNYYKPEAVSTTVGYLWAVMGIGAVIGALIAGHLRTAGRERNIMAIGMVLSAVAIWPLAGENGFQGLSIGLLLVGLMAGPVDVALLTLRQRRTEPRQLGRVMAISMSLNVAGFPVGTALAGMVMTHSPSIAFILAALISLLAALATLAIPSDRQEAADTQQKGQP